MNYETATNRHLEMTLAKLLTSGFDGHLTEYVKSGWYTKGSYPKYCTNWGDIMPIAVELGVSLTSIGEGEYSAHDGFWHHGGQIFDYNNDQCGGDPQRALVICCIKVLESKGK